MGHLLAFLVAALMMGSRAADSPARVLRLSRKTRRSRGSRLASISENFAKWLRSGRTHGLPGLSQAKLAQAKTCLIEALVRLGPSPWNFAPDANYCIMVLTLGSNRIHVCGA